MGLSVSDSGGGSYDPVGAGVHKAICYALYDLGTQVIEWQGQKKLQKKVMIIWELPEVRIDIEGEDKPRVFSKEYTASLSEKANLRRDLVGWRSRDFTPMELVEFDLKNIVGKPCNLHIVHKTSQKGNTYANLSAIIPAAPDMREMHPENPITVFDMDTDTDIPEHTPEWIKDKINDSQERQNMDDIPPEYQGRPSYPEENTDVSDIPF